MMCVMAFPEMCVYYYYYTPTEARFSHNLQLVWPNIILQFA